MADLHRSLGWLVKCTRWDPGVLIHMGTKGKRRGRTEIWDAKSSDLKYSKASMAVLSERFTVLCTGIQREAKRQRFNDQQKRG